MSSHLSLILVDVKLVFIENVFLDKTVQQHELYHSFKRLDGPKKDLLFGVPTMQKIICLNLSWLAESALEHEDVGLRLVDHVVDPARALGHSQGSPLLL